MAIVIRNGCKSFKTTGRILSNLNLNVEQASIYALLGSSGCGKTTVLSCIVGLQKLDSGLLQVMGRNEPAEASTVGFMPQETALYPMLNIKETFLLYGTIYCMTKKEIKERTIFLCKFLQLPDSFALIDSLSGGQVRRVSLAVALLHKPKLLVLDEPTVGLDPVLRENIWEHLFHLVDTQETTILITTHYHDEAKFCDKVGIMRSGRLITEQRPEDLLTNNNSNMTSAILQLCKEDEERCDSTPICISEGDEIPLQEMSFISQKQSRNFFSHRKTFWEEFLIVFVLMHKSFILYVRKPQFLITRLILPITHALLLFHTVGIEPSRMRLGVVGEIGNNSNSCFNSFISSFLNKFPDKDVTWVDFNSEEEALTNVKLGQTSGYILFPRNFSLHLRDRIILNRFSDNETITGSTVRVRLDEASTLITIWFKEKILDNYFKNVKETIEGCGYESKLVEVPLKFNSHFGGIDSWTQFINPHLMVATAFMLCSTISVFLVIERRQGIQDRGVVAGLKFRHIFASSFLLESIYTFVYIFEIFGIIWLIAGLEIKGSLFLAVILVYLAGMSGVAASILIWNLFEHEMQAIMCLLLFNSLNVVSTGGIWPLEGITSLYRFFCKLLPITVPITSLRCIMAKGLGLVDICVLNGFGLSLFSIFIFSYLSFVLFYRKTGKK